MSYSKKIDRKWQQRWDEMGLADFDESRIDRKLYVLEMFSYPSASQLHVGHWYNYGLTDSWARMKKMQGYEIFQPMGFDAFGLPAENYAIKTGIHPQDSTLENIRTMEEQLRRMGALFNWDHELATCLPDYYRWNQWLFLQLYKHGLAYRKKAPVNWCPDCQTVLANEQVMADGTCERCHSVVERKKLTQWFFRITDYADELLEGLEGLDWPEKTKKIQVNWIGRSHGSVLTFGVEKNGKPVLGDDGEPLTLRVFTTRADTLLGVTYLVIAPESDLVDLVVTDDCRERVEAYREQTSHLDEIERQSTVREKTGVFTGAYAVHPITNERVPLWTSDYVIASYGTGVVMAVPAHDTRDYAFASRFDLPIRPVIRPADGSDTPEGEAFTDDGVLINSGAYDGLSSAEAREAIVRDLEASGRGKPTTLYRLRDWLVSRQRYWGTPIPIVYCDHCGTVPVPEEALPVRLPYDVEFKPDGKSPLAKCDAFIHTTCPVCGGPATRDPDTLDTFVCSSWYMFRFVDNKNDKAPFDTEKVDKMCPVDMYVGGAEHAAMHLLYSRFITKVLRDLGYLHFDEPFRALVHQGVILGPDGQRMSKSRGNTIAPDPYIEAYGSDVFRLYLGFGFAYTDGGPWSEDGIKAIARFVSRIEQLLDDLLAFDAPAGESSAPVSDEDKCLNRARHYAIREVTRDADRFQFNTSIARLMELLNAMQKYAQQKTCNHSYLRDVCCDFMRLLAPFAPHFAEEAWERLGHDRSIFLEPWPTWEEDALVLDTVEIAVQVNGRIKSRLNVPSDADADQIRSLVENHAEFPDWLGGKSPVKWIYVPGRLLNIVVK